MKTFGKKLLVLLLCVCMLAANAVPAYAQTETMAIKGANLTLSKTEVTMTVGETIKLQAFGGSGLINVYSWKSSSSTVVQTSSTLFASNIVTLKAKKAGTATITVTCGSLKAVCNVTVVDKAAPHTHQYDNGTVTKDPTCTETGLKTYVCSCGVQKTESIPATGHLVAVERKDPTETTNGYVRETCSVCKAVIKETIIPATGHTHTWDTGVVTKPATCAAVGEKTFTCTSCGATRQEEVAIDKAAHTGATEVRNQKDATCTEAGYTGDTYCKGCGVLLAKGSVVNAQGHKGVNEHKDPTYTEAGYDRVVCSVCKTVLSNTILPKLEKPVEKKEAILREGPVLNMAMKYLAGEIDTVPEYKTQTTLAEYGGDRDYDFDYAGVRDTMIKAFKRAETMVEEHASVAVMPAPSHGPIYDTPIDVSANDVPVYMWLSEDGTIWWWSEDEDPQLPSDGCALFFNMVMLEDISGAAFIDTSMTTKMVYMFAYTYRLMDYSPVANWNVEKVKDMAWFMYRVYEEDDSNYQMRNLDAFRNWNTASLETLNNAFMGLQYLTSIEGLENWDVSNVTTLSYTFNHLHCLDTLKGLENWDTGNVESFENCFQHAHSVSDISALANWDTHSAITMKGMFRSNNKLADISPLANWDVSNVITMGGHTYAYGMFSYDAKLTDLSPLRNWNTQSLKQIGCMFLGCTGLTSVEPLGGWNVSNVLDTYGMFMGCTNLTSLNGLEGWNPANLLMADQMFIRCSKLTDISAVAGWKTPKLVSIGQIFKQCTSLTDGNAISGWTPVANCYQIFNGCTNLADVSALNSWSAKVTAAAEAFTGCSKLTELPAWGGTWENGTLVKPSSRKDLSECTITSLENSLSLCLSNKHEPTITIKDGDKTLTVNKDFKVVYYNSAIPRSRLVTDSFAVVTGIGSYQGTVCLLYHGTAWLTINW